MNVFSCRVRPGGHIFHEVNKHNVTAAEVTLLRYIHGGDDAVYNLTKTGSTKVSTREEYGRLAENYKAYQVTALFGPVSSARLPEDVEDDYNTEADPAPEPKAKPKGKAKKAEPEADPAEGLGDEADEPDDEES